ncbi:MAG: CHAT domain-containing protein, partial [Anaerolineales bacterium]|nr:CHAT domain-containing protein [Anaerolineales bacterium]
LLAELEPLVAPLADLTQPEELLILVPTGLLWSLPLHALEIAGSPLLARNPVVYAPSLNTLRHCLARERIGAAGAGAVLFGDPGGDREETAALLTLLFELLGGHVLQGDAVSQANFAAAVQGKALVHFHGHAVHLPSQPLESHLRLADYALTAREIFDLDNLTADLVSLAACSSGANVISAGDELIGLIPAFLYAGANAVLATLWPVTQTASAELLLLFYTTLYNSSSVLDKATALRQAALLLRADGRYASPYYWAPYVLHGDWRQERGDDHDR